MLIESLYHYCWHLSGYSADVDVDGESYMVKLYFLGVRQASRSHFSISPKPTNLHSTVLNSLCCGGYEQGVLVTLS